MKAAQVLLVISTGLCQQHWKITWRHCTESVFLWDTVFCLLPVLSQVNWWIALFAPPNSYHYFDTLLGLKAAHNQNCRPCCHDL
jgi:hypothetical protein